MGHGLVADATVFSRRFKLGLHGAIAITCAAMPAWSWAVDDPQAIIDSQAAEIARLRQEIDRLKGGGQPAAAPAPETAAPVVDATPAPAPGERELEKVVVKVRRTTPLEKLKDTSQSISVVSGDELQRFEVTRFQDVLKKLGNVRMAGATGLVTGQNLSTRGIGFPGGSTQDPGVGVTVDGISYAFNDMAGGFNFVDIETADASRGPQGTSGGLPSNYGRVTFRTRAPSFNDEAEASVTVGQRKTLITKAAIGGGLIDDLLAWRGTFYRETGDGPYINQYDISQSLYNKDRTSGRLQFLITPTANLNARLIFEATPKGAEMGSSSFGAFSRATPDYYDSINPNTGLRIPVNQTLEPAGRLSRRWFQQDQSYRYLDANGQKNSIERSDGPPQERETKGASAIVNWQLDDYTLSSLSGWRDYKFQWHGKNTGLRDVFDIMREPSQAWTFYKQFSQEFKLASPTGGKFDYVTGLHYLKTLTLSGQPGWGSRYGSDAGAYYATQAQYDRLDADAAGRYLMTNSVDRLNVSTDSKIQGRKLAAYGNANWHITPASTLNFGLRLSNERSEQTRSSTYISHQGFAPELNPVSVNNVALGGFATTANGNLGTNSATQLALANSVAQKYFGVADYSLLNATQKQQVADAKAIRAGRIGSVYPNTAAEPFNDTLINASISPSYKINDDHTVYVSWSHGEKPGVSQIVGGYALGGKSALTEAEKTNAYEVGLKSTYFDKTLVLNTGLFVQKIRNYIQSMYYYDATQSALDGKDVYTLALGNVPKITTQGLEIDATYTRRNTTFRAAGAWIDPKYDSFPTAAKPPELGGTSVPYRDVTGRTVAGASRLTYNLSVDHVIPIFGDKEVHAGVNYNYLSSFNPSPTLSRYAWQKGYGLTDLAVGVRTSNRKFDVTLLARNLFNVDYGSMYDWNSYSPSEPRWLGVTISTKL